MTGVVQRVLTLLFWFVLLEIIWAVLVGTTQSTELIVGLAASALGAVFATVLRSKGLLDFDPDVKLVAKAWRLPWFVLFDFGLITWVLLSSLARGRRIRGSWVRVPFPTDEGARGRWQRAFGVATANGAANALVVDLDDGQALMHALRPDIFTGKSVL